MPKFIYEINPRRVHMDEATSSRFGQSLLRTGRMADRILEASKYFKFQIYYFSKVQLCWQPGSFQHAEYKEYSWRVILHWFLQWMFKNGFSNLKRQLIYIVQRTKKEKSATPSGNLPSPLERWDNAWGLGTQAQITLSFSKGIEVRLTFAVFKHRNWKLRTCMPLKVSKKRHIFWASIAVSWPV